MDGYVFFVVQILVARMYDRVLIRLDLLSVHIAVYKFVVNEFQN